MVEMKINRLTLENFKCHEHLTLDFGGADRSLYGDNATGKTSVYDGLTWLLFGKDSLGNGEKNIDIKPLDSRGNVKDHDAITSVEAVLAVNSQERTFKRTYREVWATRRGTGEAQYEGNTSDYFVDGVPVKKNAFDGAIREMVSEDLFRMLTSVSHFAEKMRWQDRRGVLFDMAGSLGDREIMAREEKFAPLLASLGNLELEEYKKKLLYQRKGLVGTRDDTPTRINECQRVLQTTQGQDFAAARQELAELEARKEELQSQLLSMDHSAALEGKRVELAQATLELRQLEQKNLEYRRSQETGTDKASISRQIAKESSWITGDESRLVMVKNQIQCLEDKIGRSREEWVEVNGQAFAGGKCPTCGQALPFDQLQKATAAFEVDKKKRLESITAEAGRYQHEKDLAHAQVAELERDIQSRNAYIAELEQELRQAQEVNIADMEGFQEGRAAILGKIDEAKAAIQAMTADNAAAKDEVYQELEAVKSRLAQAQRVLADEAVKERTEKRVQELREEARNASQALESMEQMLYLMEEFTRFKARFVEESINGHFRLATFRLFREQANGGLEERCDAQYDGVPFQGLNNGMKVNVGIDIINALSRHYGVSVPLFVDNAEAVTRLEGCGAQVIRLVVSEEDKELRMV